MSVRRLLSCGWLCGLATLGCSLFSSEPHVVVEVDRAQYVRDAVSGAVTIVALVRNVGDQTAVLQGCADRPGDPAAHWSLERRVSGRWEGRTDGWFACAPPTFGRVDLAPAQTYTDTLVWPIDPRLYRLRVFFERVGQVGEGRFWLSDPSADFVVQ